MKSINEALFDEAKAAAGRLCFDVSVDATTCINSAQKLVAEIGFMIITVHERSESLTGSGRSRTIPKGE